MGKTGFHTFFFEIPKLVSYAEDENGSIFARSEEISAIWWDSNIHYRSKVSTNVLDYSFIQMASAVNGYISCISGSQKTFGFCVVVDIFNLSEISRSFIESLRA